MMSFPNSDLVNGDLANTLQLGLGEASLEVSFLNFFHDIPTDSKMTSHIQNAHISGQMQGLAFKGLRVGPTLLRKAYIRLANNATSTTFDALSLQFNKHRFASYLVSFPISLVGFRKETDVHFFQSKIRFSRMNLI